MPEDWRWPCTRLETKLMLAKMTFLMAKVLKLRTTKSITGYTNLPHFNEVFISMQPAYRHILSYCYLILCSALYVFFLPMSFGLHFALRSLIQKASVHFLIDIFPLLHKVERKNSPPVDFGGLSDSAVKYRAV